MCSTFPIEAKAWRFDLERGNLHDAAAHEVWVKASQPILDVPDPFVQLMIACDEDMAAVAARLASDGNFLRWGTDFIELLFEYHRRAHLMGQGGTGSDMLASSHAQNLVYGDGRGPVADPEADYVAGFLNDLQNRDGRYYEDGWKDEEVLRRMRMYQGKMRGSAGYGFVDVMAPQEEIYWVLGAVEEHCADCPLIEVESPWTKETLYTTPGSGLTPCLFNCKCWLERRDGSSSVKPVARQSPED